MVWTIKYTEIAAKQMKKLDKKISKQIDNYLNERVAKQKNPSVFGKPLLHDKSGLWRYRVENYRIICEIQDSELIVLVLRMGHRKEIYMDK
ncbi:MAG: type II toxin-antitoxin system RelE/ParE family toxin [Gammaproteobacteria bacterium]|nr:MAG: type II toxin-antitoxin system RelE/ParE family toxin [Gammaproteobacteria bacterium]